MQFDKNRWYHIRLTVTGKSINAWIDSLKVVDFTIGNRKLSIRPEVELSKPFGITSWNTTAALENIKGNQSIENPKNNKMKKLCTGFPVIIDYSFM